MIELLVKRGADVNARDYIWYQTALSQSLKDAETVKLLIRAGAKDIDQAFMSAVAIGKLPVVQALLDSGKVGQERATRRSARSPRARRNCASC